MEMIAREQRIQRQSDSHTSVRGFLPSATSLRGHEAPIGATSLSDSCRCNTLATLWSQRSRRGSCNGILRRLRQQLSLGRVRSLSKSKGLCQKTSPWEGFRLQRLRRRRVKEVGA